MQRRDKSDLPLPSSIYKYLLLWYPSFILSFLSFKSTFLAVALFEGFKNSGKDLLQQSSESPILSSSQEKWPSTLSSLRSTQHSLSSFYHTPIVLLFLYESLLSTFFLCFFFSVLPTFKPLRNWLIRL